MALGKKSEKTKAPKEPETIATRITKGIFYVPLAAIFIALAWFFSPILWLVAAWFTVFVLLPLFLPDWLAKVFTEFARVALLVIVIIAVSYWIYEYNTSGGLKSLGVFAEDIGVSERFKSFMDNLKLYVFNPSLIGTDYGSGWGGESDVVEEDVKKGIIYAQLETGRRGNVFNEGEEIRVQVPVTIDPLEEGDASITFTCQIQKEIPHPTDKTKTNKEWVDGRVEFLTGLEGNTVTVYEGRRERLTFECIFPKELDLKVVKPQKTKMDLAELDYGLVSKYLDQLEDIEDEQRQVDAQLLTYRVVGTYADFKTVTTLKVYNLASEEKNILREPYTENPIATCIEGCGLTRLSLSTSGEMPQTELGRHRVNVRINSQADYYGNVKELKYVTVTLPQTFSLEQCRDFGGDNTLDSSDPYLEYLNNRLEADQDTVFNTFFECDYKIDQPREQKGYDEISVVALYDYNMQKSGTVRIIKVEDLFKDEDELTEEVEVVV